MSASCHRHPHGNPEVDRAEIRVRKEHRKGKPRSEIHNNEVGRVTQISDIAARGIVGAAPAFGDPDGVDCAALGKNLDHVRSQTRHNRRTRALEISIDDEIPGIGESCIRGIAVVDVDRSGKETCAAPHAFLERVIDVKHASDLHGPEQESQQQWNLERQFDKGLSTLRFDLSLWERSVRQPVAGEPGEGRSCGKS